MTCLDYDADCWFDWPLSITLASKEKAVPFNNNILQLLLAPELRCIESCYQKPHYCTVDLKIVNSLVIIPWFIKDVVLVASHAFTSELGRES